MEDVQMPWTPKKRLGYHTLLLYLATDINYGPDILATLRGVLMLKIICTSTGSRGLP